MRFSFLFRAFYCALGLFLCSVVSTGAQTPPDAAPSVAVDMVALPAFEPTREEAVLEGYVDGVVAAHRREHDAPAVSVAVVRGGRLIFAKGYGFADMETRRPADGRETLFRIGSVSKTFIWTAAMMLEERGLINLDADVNQYLRTVKIPDAFGAPVTMNDLMAHRAGFEDTLEVFTYSDDSDISLADALMTTMPKRVYAPGARISYSNWGAALAAQVVEDISGVAYETFVQTEILDPLGMKNTTFSGPTQMSESQQNQLAKGYAVKAGAYAPQKPMQIGPFAPAGAMASTAQDMAQWMLVHLGRGAHNGVRLMRADTHDRMMSRAFDANSNGADLAHGFIAAPYGDIDTVGHGGAVAAYFTNMEMAPRLGLGVYVSQSATVDRTLVSDLPRLVIDQLSGEQSVFLVRDDPAFEAHAPAYAGQYLPNRRSFTRFEKLFAAAHVAVVAPAQGGALSVSLAGGIVHYAPLPGAADTFANRDGARIVFGRNKAGRITHFTDSSGVQSYERIGFLASPAWFNATLSMALLLALTSWAGAWRRLGRQSAKTHGEPPAGAILSKGVVLTALVTVVFSGLTIWMMADITQLGADALLAYPPLSVMMLRFAGLAVVALALAALLSLWPAWRVCQWSIWRKLHHALFALALIGLASALVMWNVVFAATV